VWAPDDLTGSVCAFVVLKVAAYGEDAARSARNCAAGSARNAPSPSPENPLATTCPDRSGKVRPQLLRSLQKRGDHPDVSTLEIRPSSSNSSGDIASRVARVPVRVKSTSPEGG